jgi:hypothetical protein
MTFAPRKTTLVHTAVATLSMTGALGLARRRATTTISSPLGWRTSCYCKLAGYKRAPAGLPWV